MNRTGEECTQTGRYESWCPHRVKMDFEVFDTFTACPRDGEEVEWRLLPGESSSSYDEDKT